ncbi:transcription factor-related family protein [Striga asiatica]|uniref:Transcription factor-related family protein n=1 Tax=Striga asiatica TaxID=4170 RepID=A0A5A7NY25_STRAF|nr:transcription factor-related family protein [Striga asiatica]
MGYLLKEALKTLCGVNQWSYAVFWKIGCQNPKLLIWEECYYETASCSGLAGDLNPDNSFHDYSASWVSSETCNLQSSVRAGNKIHLLVNKMMIDNQVNVFGEGLVGRVAFTGNHQWVLAENYYREAQPSEVQKELCLQFAAGMQTVAVIPVLPHGVVQFGSSLNIMENMGFVNDVTSLLLQLGYLNELPKEHTLNTVNPPCSFDSLNYISNSAEPSMIDSQTSYYLTPSQNGVHHHLKFTQPMKLDISSSIQSKNVVAKAEVIPSNPQMWSTLYYSDGGNINLKNPSFSELKNSSFSKPETNTGTKIVKSQSSVIKREIENNAGQQALNIRLPQYNELINVGSEEKHNSRDDDLFDVLGADFKNKLFSKSWNNESSSDFPTITNSRANSESGIFSSTSSDHLLEAVVSKIHHPVKWGFDESVSCATTFTNISGSSGPSSCSLPYGRFGISDRVKGESGAYSQGSSIYGSQLSSWIGSDQKGKQANSVSTGYSKKTDDGSGKMGRKRLKPGENPRPRPKDRQMIQDRVKELREIVPNGAKIISKNGGLVLKDNFEGGATWAYEVCSQSMVCPIIVEDLNQPRQMLVEMLCEERGLFLEIADIIRGLGLTILKGVMETRKDKIWARFAVEANRDVTRMEIFISLVRLLEQTTKTGKTTAESLMAQQFDQVTSIPVTSHSFQ